MPSGSIACDHIGNCQRLVRRFRSGIGICQFGAKSLERLVFSMIATIVRLLRLFEQLLGHPGIRYGRVLSDDRLATHHSKTAMLEERFGCQANIGEQNGNMSLACCFMKTLHQQRTHALARKLCCNEEVIDIAGFLQVGIAATRPSTVATKGRSAAIRSAHWPWPCVTGAQALICSSV